MLNAHGQPLRRTANDVREDFKKLKGMLEGGKISTMQHAAMTARLHDELRRIQGRRRRLALT